jgi:hypothetical protein
MSRPDFRTGALIGFLSAAVIALAIGLIAAIGDGGTDSPPKPPPGPDKPASEFETFAASKYLVEIPAGWVQVFDEADRNTYVHSEWHDPDNPDTEIFIDTKDGVTGSPQASFEKVEAEVSTTRPGYQRLASESTSIAGRDGWRWVFLGEDSAGNLDKRVDYFFNDCGTGFGVVGSTSPEGFAQWEPAFRHVVESIQVACEGTPPPTSSAPSTPPDDEVARYCSYGAVSESQLQGCVDHVGVDQVESSDTNAGQYGRGELTECLEDSGPFCEP